ncbi:hypothetical protein GWC95_10180 [Sediminibacterium roseum]|uniref:NlpE N-terminal domain-containing protein n=1 Tax=Sediminibacterium roseum TaxID=1978412 RepID=A0ABW9ZT43_9BACT|nr:hypothetical protein [Sediminibacterium roseum]NCI50290.1 hypothetical protein [Sediminibacterium roseum]
MKSKFLGMLIVLGLFTACKSDGNSEEAKPVKMSDPDCYRFAADRDTVLLSFSTGKDSVAGTLEYNLFQKDKNTGTINGWIKNDLLLADYTFMSEGTSSVRQVAFKKISGDWVEGYGDTKEMNGKVVFVNTDSLEFEPKLALKKVDCPK